MKYLIIIIVVISAPWRLHAEGCLTGSPMVIIAPHTGVTTYAKTIAVRGFLCENSRQIIVRNKTTSQMTMAETTPHCEDSQCVYSFAALVRDLAPGTNQLTAATLDGTTMIDLEVVRTALVLK